MEKKQKVLISDPHKTIIDMLYDTRLGGGIIHAIDCIKEYLQSEHRDIATIIKYMEQIKIGAVFKRLGYISECLLGEEHELTLFCKKNLTSGNAYLEPKLKKWQTDNSLEIVYT